MLQSSRLRIITKNISITTKYTKRSYFTEIISTIQSGIHGFHTATSLNWYASIPICTIMVKATLFPLIRHQIIAGFKYMTAKPQFDQLSNLLTEKLKGLKYDQTSEQIKAFTSYQKG